jgi:integrase
MAHHALPHHAGESPLIKTSKLRQSANGVWYVHYSQPDDTGRWRSDRFSTKTSDEAEAQKVLQQWLTEARTEPAADGATRSVTVAELIDHYADAKRVTATSHAAYILKPLRALLGALTPPELTGRALRDYQQVRVNPRAGGAPLSSSTLRRDLGMLTAVLNLAVREQLIARGDVPVIDLPREAPPREFHLERDQEEAFWQAAQDHGGPLALFVAIGLETAARKTAIMELTWTRVDLKNRRINFKVPGVVETKKRRVKGLMISSRLFPVLERAQAAQPEGGPLFDGALRKTWDQFVERFIREQGDTLDLPRKESGERMKITPHVMRHTWATLAAKDGVSLFHIGKVLGDSQRMVERTYAHLQAGDTDAAIDRRWKQAA